MLRFLVVLALPFAAAVWLFTRPWGLLETVGTLLGLALLYTLVLGLLGPRRTGSGSLDTKPADDRGG